VKFVFLTHLFSTLFMTGVIWFAQAVRYPVLSRVGKEAFVEYEKENTRGTVWMFILVMAVELITAILILWRQPEGLPPFYAWLNAGLLAVIWVFTFTLQGLVRGFVVLAAERGIFLYAHTDESGVEKLLRLNSQVRILWAHARMSATPQRIGQLLGKYPTLSVETSIHGDIAPGGRLDPAWRDLFLRHSDRFLIGSDTWITSRWETFIAIHSEYRSWLSGLPREVAEKLAFENAFRLVEMSPRD
jgi:hypothetical protein